MTLRESKIDMWGTDYLALGHAIAIFNSDYEDWGLNARTFAVRVVDKLKIYAVQMGCKPIQDCANEQQLLSDNNYKKFLCDSLRTIDLGMSQLDIAKLIQFIQTEEITSYSKITHQVYDYVLKKADLNIVRKNVKEFMRKDFQYHDSNYNDVEGFTEKLDHDIVSMMQKRNETNIHTKLVEAEDTSDCTVDLDEVEVNG